MDSSNLVGIFALSSAVSCHIISQKHHGVTDSWITNKWFWIGFFGSLPALVAFLGYLILEKKRPNE